MPAELFMVEEPTRQAVRNDLNCATASFDMPQSGHITSIASGSTARLGNSIDDFVIDAAEPAFGDHGHDVRRRSDTLLVGLRKGVRESGFVMAGDANGRGTIGKNLFATEGTLASAEKINSETAIERMVRIERRRLRRRFLSTSQMYFMR